jgi:predicted esterase
MSIFPVGALKPDLKNAKGKPYYLLQSPEDQVTKYHFRELARKALAGAGAVVETADYEGGHGWHGEVFGNIRKGIEWLENAVKNKT